MKDGETQNGNLKETSGPKKKRDVEVNVTQREGEKDKSEGTIARWSTRREPTQQCDRVKTDTKRCGGKERKGEPRTSRLLDGGRVQIC